MAGASPSDDLMSYTGHSLGGVLLLCKDAVGVFYGPTQLGSTTLCNRSCSVCVCMTDIVLYVCLSDTVWRYSACVWVCVCVYVCVSEWYCSVCVYVWHCMTLFSISVYILGDNQTL